MHSLHEAEQQAELVILSLFNLLSYRERTMGEQRLGGRRAAAGASSSSSSYSGSEHNVSRAVQSPPLSAAAAAAGKTVIPCEQQLLLPLALTVIELLLLLPRPSQCLMPTGLQRVWHMLRSAHSASEQSCVHSGSANAATHALQAAHFDVLVNGLAAPLLLQLAPAALRYINQAEAAAAAAAAAALGSSSRSSGTDLGDVKTCLGGLVSVVLAEGEHGTLDTKALHVLRMSCLVLLGCVHPAQRASTCM
jgi:hypothetical protein